MVDVRAEMRWLFVVPRVLIGSAHEGLVGHRGHFGSGQCGSSDDHVSCELVGCQLQAKGGEKEERRGVWVDVAGSPRLLASPSPWRMLQAEKEEKGE